MPYLGSKGCLGWSLGPHRRERGANVTEGKNLVFLSAVLALLRTGAFFLPRGGGGGGVGFGVPKAGLRGLFFHSPH